MLAAELALAQVDVAIVGRRPNQHFAGARAGGLHVSHFPTRNPYRLGLWQNHSNASSPAGWRSWPSRSTADAR
ncbi:hypothetical protein [Arthrobacter sp. PGP41]|nr:MULTISPECIES: hypothetical protein [unclassified Arthrobacter]MDT0197206.1 hypothetical protein [Arthrobacter sp. AB6]